MLEKFLFNKGKELDIKEQDIKGKGKEIKEFIIRNTKLEKVVLDQCDLSSNDIELLMEGLKENDNIKTLVIADDSVIEIIAKHISDTKVTNLMIVDSNFAEQVKYLTQMIETNNTLESINLSHNDIHDSLCAEIFAAVKKNTTLKQIIVKHSDITSKSVINAVENLTNHPSVRWVDFQDKYSSSDLELSTEEMVIFTNFYVENKFPIKIITGKGLSSQHYDDFEKIIDRRQKDYDIAQKYLKSLSIDVIQEVDFQDLSHEVKNFLNKLLVDKINSCYSNNAIYDARDAIYHLSIINDKEGFEKIILDGVKSNISKNNLEKLYNLQEKPTLKRFSINTSDSKIDLDKYLLENKTGIILTEDCSELISDILNCINKNPKISNIIFDNYKMTLPIGCQIASFLKGKNNISSIEIKDQSSSINALSHMLIIDSLKHNTNIESFAYIGDAIEDGNNSKLLFDSLLSNNQIKSLSISMVPYSSLKKWINQNKSVSNLTIHKFNIDEEGLENVVSYINQSNIITKLKFVDCAFDVEKNIKYIFSDLKSSNSNLEEIDFIDCKFEDKGFLDPNLDLIELMEKNVSISKLTFNNTDGITEETEKKMNELTKQNTESKQNIQHYCDVIFNLKYNPELNYENINPKIQMLLQREITQKLLLKLVSFSSKDLSGFYKSLQKENSTEAISFDLYKNFLIKLCGDKKLVQDCFYKYNEHIQKPLIRIQVEYSNNIKSENENENKSIITNNDPMESFLYDIVEVNEVNGKYHLPMPLDALFEDLYNKSKLKISEIKTPSDREFLEILYNNNESLRNHIEFDTQKISENQNEQMAFKAVNEYLFGPISKNDNLLSNDKEAIGSNDIFSSEDD